jgi:hypothetical protein
MRGARLPVVAATAAFALIAVPATAEPPPSTLPVGTAVVFVTDGSLDPMPRDHAVLAVHLRDPLVLDGVVIGPAGTKAKLRVSYPDEPGVRHVPTVRLEEFTIPAGLLPVRALHAIALPVATGETIEAATQAEVQHIGSRYSIVVPFPFPLSGDRPEPSYPAPPAKTASPHSLEPPQRRRGGPPTPLPTASPSPTPGPDASGSPAPGATGSASPSPSPAASALPAASARPSA